MGFHNTIARINTVRRNAYFSLLGCSIVIWLDRDRFDACLGPDNMLDGCEIFFRQPTMCYNDNSDQASVLDATCGMPD
jgi:hypothetical protein